MVANVITRNKKVLEKFNLQGIWQGKSFNPSRCSYHAGMTDEQILQDLKKRRPQYLTLLDFINELNCCSSVHYFKKENKIVDGLVDTFLNRLTNTNTATEDLIARKMAVGTNDTAPSSGNAQLLLEKFRADFDDSARITNTGAFDLFLRRNSGANSNSSLVVADVGNSLTQVKITTGEVATKFKIGDRVRVTTISGFNFVNILNKDIVNDIITFDVSLPLAEIPQAGDEIIQVIAEAGLVGNGNTSINANTGTLFNRVNSLETVKTVDVIFVLEAKIIVTVA